MPPLTDRDIEAALPRYEGLIYATARRIEGVVEMPFEDIRSELRIKAWKALQRFDPDRSTVSEKVFVGHAVINKKKDILRDDKGQKRTIIFIEDMLKSVRFDQGSSQTIPTNAGNELRHLSVDSGDVYERIERELPLIPSTLTDVERHVLVMLYDEHTILDIQRAVGVKRQDVKDAIEAIKVKFGDWKPGPAPEAQRLQAAA